MPKDSFVDWLLNRIPNLAKQSPEENIGIFRNVPGRYKTVDVDALPVRIVNNDEYGMSQSSFTLAVANTEYAIDGIATLSAIIIKARGGNVKFSIYEGQSNLVYTLILDG